MKDTRLQQALAALDDARTILADIFDEVPGTSIDHAPLFRAVDDVDRAVRRVKAVMS